jgi:plastocyanin
MRSAFGAAAVSLGAALVLAGGCGGGGDSNPNPSPLVLAKEPSASGDAQTGPVSNALPNDLKVIVTRDGSPQTGVSVTWSTTNGTLDPTSGPTDATGIAASTWVLGPTAGGQTAQASVQGATGSPVTFTATATGGPPPPPPLVLAKAPTESGDAQTGPVSQALPNDLRIIVTREGSPESGVTVTWSTSNGSLTPTSGPTDGSGIAASTWTLGANAGAQTAQAAVTGATGSPVSFTATATGPPPPPPPDAINITVGNIFFKSDRNATSNPAVDTLAVNGTATWTWVNTGATPHSAQSTGTPSFTSSALLTGNGQTYEFQFTQAGTYTYNCAEHGNLMTGRIVVR